MAQKEADSILKGSRFSSLDDERGEGAGEELRGHLEAKVKALDLFVLWHLGIVLFVNVKDLHILNVTQ